MSIRAVIAANGEMNADAAMMRHWQSADLRIAADGGARNAREHLSLPPHVIIGDMDSLDEVTGKWLAANDVEQLMYPRAKDKTDLELAIDLARGRGADDIRVFGALGGRLDQTIANVLLLSAFTCVFEDSRYEVQALTASSGPAETLISAGIGDTVSLIPISDSVQGIETEGMQFPLKKETLARGTTRGVSNVLEKPTGRVRIERGTLLIVRLKPGAAIQTG